MISLLVFHKLKIKGMLNMYRTEVLIKGKLDGDWSDWFDGMKIQYSTNGDTILIGNLPDKSAVYGVLSKLTNLGFDLICLTCKKLTVCETK
jgi:hypothetical protein